MTTIANDTVTGTASSFSSVRGTLAHSSGKHYFEIKVLTAPTSPLLIVGIMDNTTATGSAMDDNAIIASAGNSIFNGNPFTDGSGYNGVSLGTAINLVDGDVLGYAADHDAGIITTINFGYLALNNVWYLSADPTSSSGTGSVANGALAGARPMLSVWGASNGLYQLITTTGAFTYSPPSGYVAWG